jgi:hypothetical protein
VTIAVLTAAGTWAPWHVGYPADVARGVTSEWDIIQAEILGKAGPDFRWQGLGYPAVGFLNPDPNTSYNESVQMGLDEGVRLGLEAHRNGERIVIIGYSQGAEVAVRVASELYKHGITVLAVITFGSPCRRPGPTLTGNNPPGSGISRYYGHVDLWPLTHDFTLPGDMYPNAPEDTYLPEFYELFVQAETSIPFFGAVIKFLTPFVFAGFSGMITGGIFGAIGAVDIPKAIKTMSVAMQFASTNAHGSYHLPRSEYGGRSATGAAIDILNGLAEG